MVFPLKIHFTNVLLKEILKDIGTEFSLLCVELYCSFF